MNNRPLSVYGTGIRLASPVRPTSRSSMRSRRSATRMTTSPTPQPVTTQPTDTAGPTDSQRSSDQPSIVKTSPSGKRATIHSYIGPVSEPDPIQRSVRIAFPATTAVVSAPGTPFTASTFSSSGNAAGVTDDVSRPDFNSLQAAPGVADFGGQVDPLHLFRTSYLGVKIEGNPEMFQQLCDNIDGLPKKLRAAGVPISQRPQPDRSSQSLPYIPKTPTLSFDSDADVEAGGKSRRDQHRSAALAALESPALVAPTATADQTDHPDSLLPCQLPVKQRPVNLSGLRPATTGGLYLAYPRRFNPFNDALTSPITAGAARPSNRDSGESSTPSFADTHTHSQHYNRVESGIFDSPVSGPPRPANPEPPARLSEDCAYFAANSPESGGAAVPPPNPPSPPTTSAGPATQQIKRKPVAAARTAPNFSRPRAADTYKSLPPAPGPADPRRFTNGVVPATLDMNANGFPMIKQNRASYARPAGSSQPPKTFGAIEAKHNRESSKVQAKQQADMSASAAEAKQNRASAKAQAKQEKSQQKQKAQRFASAIEAQHDRESAKAQAKQERSQQKQKAHKFAAKLGKLFG